MDQEKIAAKRKKKRNLLNRREKIRGDVSLILLCAGHTETEVREIMDIAGSISAFDLSSGNAELTEKTCNAERFKREYKLSSEDAEMLSNLVASLVKNGLAIIKCEKTIQALKAQTMRK